MLVIENLTVEIENKKVLTDLSLTLRPAETHLIMGPNGAGKSTLAKALIGHPSCAVTKGRILFRGRDLASLPTHTRAGFGLFMSFQNPVEIAGVSIFQFLFLATNAVRKMRDEKVVTKVEFQKLLDEACDSIVFPRALVERSINEGFSGGEKKQFEVLQMALLLPELAILDEIDSGLDVDAIKRIAAACRQIMQGKTLLVITHNPNLAATLNPDVVHIMQNGRILDSGDRAYIEKIKKEGYSSWKAR